ncbi:MAG: methyltransferase domain-containing protein [Pseudomonadota bacterium]
MTEERDYLLGTHDAEVERLGLQHRVWRPRVLDAWRRAGIRPGQRVIDAGAGPGWASLDLAEIVGPTGRVHAIERSARFMDILGARAQQRGLDNIDTRVADLVTDPVDVSGADAFWIRWVLAFVSDPAAVVAKLAAALRPGGRAIIHEYLNYESFGVLPDSPAVADFKRYVIDDWRASGGEPDIGRALPHLLPAAGFRILSMKPIVDTVTKQDFVWQWTSSWGHAYPKHLAAEGKVTAEWADRVVAAFEAAENDPHAVMITPTVVEIIAEKL